MENEKVTSQLIFRARSKTGSNEYEEMPALGLSARVTGKSPDADYSKLIIEISATEDFEGVIRMGMPVGSLSPRFYLPGFMYGTNRGGAPLKTDSLTPRLRLDEEFPANPWWMVRGDRLSHPCALAYTEGRVRGFAASPYYQSTDGEVSEWYPGRTGDFLQYAGFGCSLEAGEVWYTLGYENAPYLFTDSHKYSKSGPLSANCIKLEKGGKITFTLHCFDYEADDERGIHRALIRIYDLFHEEPGRRRTPIETIKDISTAIARDAWIADKHTYSGFVFDKPEGYEYRILPSISWTNGLSATVPMLMSAHTLGDESMRTQALDSISHIVSTSINPLNGLPFTAEIDGVWGNHGWWYDKQPTPGHAAYLVGQSVYLLLKAYEWEKYAGHVHSDWLEFAGKVVAVTEQSRNTDGEYPYIFSDRTGSGLSYDSFSGAWCMAAAAYYSYITGESRYIEGIRKSEKWYHETYICHQECYGGPLDIDKNIDSEGILSYIRAVRYLHMITHDEILLDHLRDALYYEFTFKFCYNSPIKVPPLSKVGWSSSGGSITSVTNPHIHPMSSSVIGEMEYYSRIRDDEYIASRLNDTILWSCQCHNTYDREFDYGKTGWMSERFCHSQGLLTEHYPDGSVASTWFALMPWACGSILEGLNSLEQYKDEADI
ncbi:MAG: hypothetical protein K5673_03985 [Lachnospiraceae bacterium]|nr:hypothetical protein [Lachnospiraceae bacterium]